MATRKKPSKGQDAERRERIAAARA
ncbi:MAG: hypothetical protein JWN52_6384, partial [Actinomycetia bacterium]|nr:hypothetical protein [Actinomycetes bacterium]